MHPPDGNYVTLCVTSMGACRMCVLGWMSVCIAREGVCLRVLTFTHVRICVNVCESLSVCVIRVKKYGYLCHFGQSGKGRHCVCNLYTQGEGVYV